MEFSILNLFLVLLAAWSAGLIAVRIGYPAVLGELLAGIVLGPPLLGLLEGSAALNVLAELGILLMMVYIGMEIDPRELQRASKAGLLAAVGGFITPFVGAYFVIIWAGGTPIAGVMVGLAAGVTSLATKSRILVDLKLLDTRIAHVMMAGALIADTISLVLFAGVLGVAEAGSLDPASLVVVVGKAALFFGLAVLLGLKGLPVLGRGLRRIRGAGRTASFTLVLLIALLYAELAELAGMHGILGAFLAGLFLREGVLGRDLSKGLMEAVRDASIGLLAPVFFVTAGFAVSLDVFTTDLGLLILIIGVATIGKILGTVLFYLPTGYGWREGLTIGAGMNGRGAVEIIVAQIGLSMGLISQEIFSILVFMAIATTATVPLFLKWGTDWLRRRGELVRSTPDRSGVLVVGAGPTARALGRALGGDAPVRLVDRNPAHVAAAEADGLTAVSGNALDEETLHAAGAASALHFVAITPNAEVNALASRTAREIFGIPHIHVVDSGDARGHAALLDHVGGTTLFGGPVGLAAWDYRLVHGEAALHERPATAETPASTPAIPLAIRRGGQTIPYHGGIAPEPNDTLVVLAEAPADPSRTDVFDRLAAACPILDLPVATDLSVFFRQAADRLAPDVGLDADTLVARLSDRERLRTSVLLPGLAIPHVLLDDAARFGLLAARCRPGIAFPDPGVPGGVDRVHTAFLLAGPAEARTTHLELLAALAQIIERPGFEADWLNAPDDDALRALLRDADRRRTPSA